MVEGHFLGVQGIKFVEPLVFQIQGIDQQQSGVLAEGLVDDTGDQLVGLFRDPCVQVVHDPLVGQLRLIHLCAIVSPAFGHKVLVDIPLNVLPEAVGDGEFGGAV